MLYRSRIFLVLILSLLLGGCAHPSWTTAGKISPPEYSLCPLEGKWSVIGEAGGEEQSEAARAEAYGPAFQFSREIAVLGDNVYKQPDYKIKTVNSGDYLMSRYIVLDNHQGSHEQKVDVITVFADSNFLGEFMKIDDSSVIAFVQNEMLLLSKVAEHTDDLRLLADSPATGKQHDNTGTSGVFIGLRIPSEDDYLYRTVWIAADDKKLRPLLSQDDIYFPRQSGFWELQVNSASGREGIGAALSAHNLAIKDAGKIGGKPLAKISSADKQNIIVNYISNDFAAVEKTIDGISKLQVLPVDKLSSPIGIKALDLLGDTGWRAYCQAREQTRQILNVRGVTLIDEDVNDDNLGLIRNNGHWYLQGRINYHRNGNPGSTAFNINFIPPANLVAYDTLYLSWQSIKDRIPNAVDAFTSPNRNIAIVEGKNKLYFFGISGEQLESLPLGEMKLQEGSSIIMAEWSTGPYVDDWEKSFLAHGASVVK